MTLQFKFALYNSFTKITIILLMGFFTSISVERLSIYHITTKLNDKKEKFLRNINSDEISDLLRSNQLYKGYNILREEFIFIKKAGPDKSKADVYRTEMRTIDGQQQEYRILEHPFIYENNLYTLEIGETLEGVKALEKAIQTFTIVLLISALALTLILDIIFTGVLLRPFYQIIDQKIKNTNDPVHFDYNAVKTTTKDFQQLDESISSLMIKLGNLFTTQRQFIANVSHELLTPISIIRIRIENILNAEELSEQLENKMYANLKTLNRLKSLVNSLLLISKIENNQYLQNDSVQVDKLTSEVLEELEDKITDRQIHIEQNTEPVIFRGNNSLIQIMLFNLINNAVKYNKANGKLLLTGKKSGTRYLLQIADTGLGMTDEEAKLAFNRFEKLDSSVNESHGLGLAIVKSIANFHHIKIDISTQKNVGTEFSLTFLI